MIMPRHSSIGLSVSDGRLFESKFRNFEKPGKFEKISEGKALAQEFIRKVNRLTGCHWLPCAAFSESNMETKAKLTKLGPDKNHKTPP